LELSRELFVREAEATEVREVLSRPSLTYWQDAWRRLKMNKVAMAGLGFLVFMTAIAIIAPMLSRYNYHQIIFEDVAKTPTFSGVRPHWFGTDDLGRDLWVRVWYGGRISLFIGVVAAFLNLLVGALYGGISGYIGGRTDDIMMRIVEVIYAIPELLLLILLMLIFKPGLSTIIFVMAMTFWVGMARLVRGQVLQIKEQEYVLAARTLGASPLRIIIKHLLPNAMGPILVNLSMAIPAAIFFEAALSFIGMGVRTPIASWGSLANDGKNWMLLYPHMLVYPAIAIALTMLAFNLFGDGLRDALDPKLRGRD
jgi:ABC-type dipeptide/oligopeptide/nickel transport system permease subunit